MSKVIKVESLNELEETLVERGNVVVVFSAVDWCVPCQRLAKHLPAVAEALPDCTFLDVDVDHVDGVKENFGIMTVPQVWFYESTAAEGVEGRELKGRTAVQLINELKR